MKIAVVTGANGFIGRWLVHELSSNGIEVYAVVRPGRYGNLDPFSEKVHLVECDLKDYRNLAEKLENKSPDVFYHLAWDGIGGAARADYERQLLNEKYACDAAMAAKEVGCGRFIGIGTITEKITWSEKNRDSKAENMIYGICKTSLRQILGVLCRRIGIQFVWARLSNIYGPYNRTGNIMNYLLEELEKGNHPEFSRGEEYYDLMYVEDTARALRLLGQEKEVLDEYFIGSGTPMLLKDYLIKIAGILGKESDIRIGARPEDGIHYEKEWFDIGDLEKDTGFRPSYTLKEGVEKTLEWLKESKDV